MISFSLQGCYSQMFKNVNLDSWWFQFSFRLLLFVEWWHQNLTFWQTEALYLLFGSSLVNILVAYPINIWLDGLGRFNIDVFQFRFLNMKNNSKINRRNFFLYRDQFAFTANRPVLPFTVTCCQVSIM